MAKNYDSWSGFAAGTNIAGNGYTRRGDNSSGSPTVTADASGNYEADKYVALASGSSNPFTPDGASSATGLQQSYIRARPQATTDWVMVAYARVATTGDTMYGCGLHGTTQVRFFRLIGGVYSGLDSWTVPLWAVNDLVHILFEVDDSGSDAALRMKFWRNAESEPASWTRTYTDTSPISGGWPGFGQRDSLGSQARFDVFSWGTNEAAPLTASTGLATPSSFSFTAGSGVRTLDGSWTAVSGAATYDYEVDEDVSGVWTSFASANTASTSFQLTDANGVAWGTSYRGRVRAQP